MEDMELAIVFIVIIVLGILGSNLFGRFINSTLNNTVIPSMKKRKRKSD
jgi:hypothetical protein